MYVVQPPMFPPRYDDALPSAPQFPEHLHSLLTYPLIGTWYGYMARIYYIYNIYDSYDITIDDVL